MGNGVGLPYDILDAVDYQSNNHWQLNKGSQKEGGKQQVSIFRFVKAGRSARLPLAQRNIQKLRTIRHPHVLTYIDSLDTEEALMLVTEQCTPLEKWLADLSTNTNGAQQNLVYELLWGFKGILKALDFLHSNASLIHGNLGVHSIFVTQSGDWKLGAFDLVANMTNSEDVDFFANNHAVLEAKLIAPECRGLRAGDSVKIEAVLKAKIPPFYLDMYSLGQTVQSVFEVSGAELSGSLSKYIANAVHSDMKKRPSAGKLLSVSVFNSDYIKILENVQEFAIKGQKEILESIKELDPLLPQMTIPICSHKVLPSVCKVMQIAVNDFQNRDARESCRQSIVVCVDLLAKLAGLKKIDDVVFQQDCLQVLVQLWTMTDRTVRTALLSSLKQLAELVPNTVVNRSLFDNMLAGFSDSNAKLRESTLMSLIYVVDKLDETQLQDRLVRCVVNLQNDPEASIRTNATIFLGKIAAKLKESVRARVLCTALAKSMKDNFVHCRMAGLKTSIACVKLMDIPQLATKIIPQAAILLLDKSTDVRTLALTLMDASMNRMRVFHEETTAAQKEARDEERNKTQSTPSSSSSSANAQGGGGGGAGSSVLSSPMLESWTSWGMQGLSKTLDMDTSSGAADKRIGELRSTQSQAQITSPSSAANTTQTSSFSSKVHSHTQPSASSSRAAAATMDEDEVDLGDVDMDDDNSFFDAKPFHQQTAAASTGHASSASTAHAIAASSDGWGDDDLDSALRFDDNDAFDDNSSRGAKSSDGNRTPVLSTATAKKTLASTASLSSSTQLRPASDSFGSYGQGLATSHQQTVPKVSSVGSDLSASSLTTSKKIGTASTASSSAAKAKPAVKKLEFSKDDDWEDF